MHLINRMDYTDQQFVYMYQQDDVNRSVVCLPIFPYIQNDDVNSTVIFHKELT